MKPKEFTEDEIIEIKRAHYTMASNDRDRALGEQYGVSERSIRRWLKKLGLTSGVDELNSDILRAKKRELDKKKYYIITSAQNATNINKGLWANIVAYAEHLDAAIHVIPFRYKNPTSNFSDGDHDYWAQELLPFLDMNRHSVHKDLQFLSDVKIQPTATNPLSGLEGMTGHQSCIVGHPRMQLKSMPTLDGYHQKVMMTSGVCTVPNYTDSKAGKRGEFHHIYGFAIVEIKDKNIFYMRQVSATDEGNFIDLIYDVRDGVVSKINSCKGWRLGDIHVRDVDHDKIAENIRTMNVLVPEKVVLDDVFDGSTVNHHSKDNHIERIIAYKAGNNSISEEIDEMIDWLNMFMDKTSASEYVITKSNHDLWLDRYMNSAKWQADYANADIILKLQSVAVSGEANNGLIAHIIHERTKYRYLRYNESYIIGNTECSQHGHIGVNGAKGAHSQFRNLSMKICTAHSHSISRYDGFVCVGTSTHKRIGYNIGASGWIQCDVIFDNNNKYQQIIFADDKRFTTLF
jgi:transposase